MNHLKKKQVFMASLRDDKQSLVLPNPKKSRRFNIHFVKKVCDEKKEKVIFLLI